MDASLITIESGDANEVLDMEKAKQVGAELEKHYPGHPWMVSFQGRVLIVRHMEINEFVFRVLGREGFGFVLKHGDTVTASELAKHAMRAGGQLLEAFGLPRGPWRGEPIQLPEGWVARRPETFN
jgi:hypothetical protein